MRKQILTAKIIIGAVSAFFGSLMLGMGTGGLQDFMTYGGEAYTGIQQAAAQTAYNIVALSIIVKYGFAFILYVIGAVLITPAALTLKKINKDARKQFVDNYMKSVQQAPATQAPAGVPQYVNTNNVYRGQ